MSESLHLPAFSWRAALGRGAGGCGSYSSSSGRESQRGCTCVWVFQTPPSLRQRRGLLRGAGACLVEEREVLLAEGTAMAQMHGGVKVREAPGTSLGPCLAQSDSSHVASGPLCRRGRGRGKAGAAAGASGGALMSLPLTCRQWAAMSGCRPGVDGSRQSWKGWLETPPRPALKLTGAAPPQVEKLQPRTLLTRVSLRDFLDGRGVGGKREVSGLPWLAAGHPAEGFRAQAHRPAEPGATPELPSRGLSAFAHVQEDMRWARAVTVVIGREIQS